MAEGTTRRVADGIPVAFRDAQTEWARVARAVLEDHARTYGSVIKYQQLAEEVQQASGITTQVPFRHWIGSVLGALARDQPVDEPILTSLVVRADGTIGDGYAIPVTERDGTAPADLEEHAAAERLACYRHFGATLPADGGRPVYTSEVAKRRRQATRQPQPSDTCPTCFTRLPLTGSCAQCDPT